MYLSSHNGSNIINLDHVVCYYVKQSTVTHKWTLFVNCVDGNTYLVSDSFESEQDAKTNGLNALIGSWDVYPGFKLETQATTE